MQFNNDLSEERVSCSLYYCRDLVKPPFANSTNKCKRASSMRRALSNKPYRSFIQFEGARDVVASHGARHSACRQVELKRPLAGALGATLCTVKAGEVPQHRVCLYCVLDLHSHKGAKTTASVCCLYILSTQQ